MKKKTSRKRHLFLTKNFIMMLVVAVVIVMAISAWFTSNSSADASGIYLVSENPGVDIAPCIKTYNADGTVKTDGPGEFGNGFSIVHGETSPDESEVYNLTLSKDCTGNGENLWVPEFNITKDYDNVRVNGGKEVNTNVAGVAAESQEWSRIQHMLDPTKDAPEYHFIELEFYARTQNDSLKLVASSKLQSETEASGGDLSAAPAQGSPKRSAYGAFNVDGVVGAMRVAILGEACNVVNQEWAQTTGTEGKIISTDCPTASRSGRIKQVLWYPRPDVKLNIPDTPRDVTNWSLTTGLTGGDTFKNSYYMSNGTGMVLVSDDQDAKTKVSSAAPMLGEDVNISDFNDFDQNTVELVETRNQYQKKSEYYLYKYTLRIWIEGTDSEARRAMDGGQFQLTLKFE